MTDDLADDYRTPEQIRQIDRHLLVVADLLGVDRLRVKYDHPDTLAPWTVAWERERDGQ